MELFKYFFILFIIYAFVGWVIEVIVTFNKCKFTNRGFLIGPYCPIYGVGALLIYLCLNRLTNPLIIFVLSLVLCSFLEYFTGYFMEKLFKARWWDYKDDFLNLHGRICLSSSIMFGIAGMFLILIINPFIMSVLDSIPSITFNILFYFLFLLFVADFILSIIVVTGITKKIKFIREDNTKELTERVKMEIQNNILKRRLFKAFPNMRIIVKRRIKDFEQFKDELKEKIERKIEK